MSSASCHQAPADRISDARGDLGAVPAVLYPDGDKLGSVETQGRRRGSKHGTTPMFQLEPVQAYDSWQGQRPKKAAEGFGTTGAQGFFMWREGIGLHTVRENVQ